MRPDQEKPYHEDKRLWTMDLDQSALRKVFEYVAY